MEVTPRVLKSLKIRALYKDWGNPVRLGRSEPEFVNVSGAQARSLFQGIDFARLGIDSWAPCYKFGIRTVYTLCCCYKLTWRICTDNPRVSQKRNLLVSESPAQNLHNWLAVGELYCKSCCKSVIIWQASRRRQVDAKYEDIVNCLYQSLPSCFLYHLFLDAAMNMDRTPLKGTDRPDYRSAREWYQWIGLSKDMSRYRFLIF